MKYLLFFNWKYFFSAVAMYTYRCSLLVCWKFWVPQHHSSQVFILHSKPSYQTLYVYNILLSFHLSLLRVCKHVNSNLTFVKWPSNNFIMHNFMILTFSIRFDLKHPETLLLSSAALFFLYCCLLVHYFWNK